MTSWLEFFRIVNLPTVPGDVLVGVATVVWGVCTSSSGTAAVEVSALAIGSAALASMALYLFGLADNDIVGAGSDSAGRPIPAGRLSLASARVARGLCLFSALIVGALANLPQWWWVVAFLLAVAIVIYNRTKWSVAMGLCRGLNVLCGGAALMVKSWRGVPPESRAALLIAGAVWMLYIAAVTKFSEGESTDPEKRQLVGMLVGMLIYLQLGALVLCYWMAPCEVLRNLTLVGAGLLIALRMVKRLCPKVSAS